FDAEKWDIIPQEKWQRVRMELEDADLYDKEGEIYASHIDEQMIQIELDNSMEVDLDGYIHFEVMDVDDFSMREKAVQLVTNPPDGERIGEAKAVEDMYRTIGKLMKSNPTLSVYVMTSNKEFEHIVGKKATKRRKLFNGYIETTFFQYWGKRAED